MIINQKEIKRIINSRDKRCARGFLIKFDEQVRAMLEVAIMNSKNFKTVNEHDLYQEK
jgi:hypothetical protein